MKALQTGFSLTELMIALMLSLFIMTGLMNFYISCKRQYQEHQVRLKEAFDWQWMMSLLSDSIKHAGFTPCMKLDFLKSIPVKSLEITAAGFKVARMHANFNQVVKVQDSTRLLVGSDFPLSVKYPVLISDCIHAEIHQPVRITKTDHGQLITLETSLAFDYPHIAWIGEWLEEHWFIRKNSRGEPALYYQRNKAVELSNVIGDWKIKKRHMNGKNWLEMEFMPDAEGGERVNLIVGLRNA